MICTTDLEINEKNNKIGNFHKENWKIQGENCKFSFDLNYLRNKKIQKTKKIEKKIEKKIGKFIRQT